MVLTESQGPALKSRLNTVFFARIEPGRLLRHIESNMKLEIFGYENKMNPNCTELEEMTEETIKLKTPFLRTTLAALDSHTVDFNASHGRI
jgi:hypothetical protein